MSKSRLMKVPFELIEEAEIIKKTEGCMHYTDAFRRIARDYSPIGREIKSLDTKKLIKKIITGGK